MSTTHAVPNQTIREAVRFIRSRCDGAVERDGEGFDGQDVKFGHRAASLTDEQWDDETHEEVLRILGKYTRQLSELLDEEAIEAVRAGAAASRKYTSARDRARRIEKGVVAAEAGVTCTKTHEEWYTVRLAFSHTGEREALKATCNPRWNALAKVWEVPASSSRDLLEWCEQYATQYDREALLAEVEVEHVALRGKLHLTEDGAHLRWEWDPWKLPNGWDIKEAVKALPRSSFTGTSWVTPLSEAAIEVAARYEFLFISDSGLSLGEALHRLQKAEEEAAAKAEAAKLLSRAHEPTGIVEVAIPEHLYGFQRAGVEYVVAQGGRAFIADEMGLGKTRQAISAILTLEATPAIVVCPASLKGNWRREVEALSELTVYVASGTKLDSLPTEAAEADVVIVNYDILAAWEPFIEAPRALVLDESHYVKTPKAQRSKAALALSGRVPEDGLVLLLTGTPVLNRPVELVNQLKVAGLLSKVAPAPSRGTSERDYEFAFKFAYCGPEHNGHGWTFMGATNSEELNERLRAAGYVRRLKADVLTELPEKLEPVRVWLSLNGALKAYRKAEDNLLAYLAENGGPEAVAAAERAEVLVKLNLLRKLAGEAKLKAAVEWIENWLDSNPDESLVVFAAHREVQAGLVEALKGDHEVVTILGSQKDVEEHKARFQNKEARVLVASLKAAREGHTLTAASNVLFIEQGWTPGEHLQAEDRCHRIGQTQDVQPWYLLAEDTVDEAIRALIDSKAEVVKATSDGVDTEVSADTITEVLKALTNRETKS